MRGYKEPGFQERTAIAARARNSALEKLRARPTISPEELARRAAAQAARDAIAAEKREATRLAREAAAAARVEAEREAARAAKESAEAEAAALLMTESERKAARDARYAARKGRRS